MAKVCILGGGSWGIGLSVVLHKNGHEVTVWSAVPAEIQMLQENHEHKMLPGVKLPEDMIFTTDDKQAIEGKDLLVMAVASSYTRSTAHRISPLVAQGQKIVSVSKGIEEHTLMTQAQIIEDEIPQAQVAVLSGPTHAEEVSRGIPTTIVAGSKSKSCAEYVQNLFMNEVFRVYTHDDTVGVELAGALKNVAALCCGISDGCGMGDNTRALLITRSLSEISRLAERMGGRKETLAGLAGMGDLIVTCTSMHSRNHRAGILIGQGKSTQEAMDEVGAVVEGYYAARSAHELAQRCGVEMPISTAVYEVLYEGKSAAPLISVLMSRTPKKESDCSWL